MKRVLTLFFALLFLVATGVVPAAAATELPKIDSQLAAWLAANPERDTVKVWVYFKDKGLAEGARDEALAERRSELGRRTLARRAKVRSGRLVDERDLPLNPSYREAVLALGPQQRADSRVLNAVSVEARRDQLGIIAALDCVAGISRVAGFTRREVMPVQPPESTAADGSRALDYGSSFAQLDQINVPALHDMGLSGAGVVVCMLDTGFYKAHEAFAGLTVLAEWDFINDDGNTQNEGSDPSSQHNHGTYTWSTLGGLKPGTLYGPAYGASFLLAKTEDTSQEVPIEEDWWVEGIEWAELNGADVVSSSLGYTDWYVYADMDGQTCVTTIAANWAVAQGVVVCNAMGNNGQYAGALIAPADSAGVISCGAVSSSGSLAYFSSSGPTYDGRTKPDVCARGVSTYCASSSGSYTSVDGTSLSTPLVGGVAALLVEAHPDWTPAEVQLALRQTASQAASPDNNYGWGILNAQAAVLSAGYGQVDGVVRNAALEPLAAHLDVLENSFSADTDPGDGAYSLLVDPDVDQTLRVTSFGYLPRQQVVNVPADGMETVNFTLVAAATGTVQGTVSDSGGSPLSGVAVSVPGTPVTPVSTNSAGAYSLALPGGDSYDLRYALAGYSVHTESGVAVTEGSTTTVDVSLADWPSILIWEPDPTPSSGAAMQTALATLGWDSVRVTDLFQYGTDLTGYQAVFVLVGIYSNNYTFSSGSAEEAALVAYLDAGGSLYLEGGDVWNFDTNPTTLRGYFNTIDEGDGSADLSTVTGAAGTFAAGMALTYGGENNWIDRLGATAPAYELLVNTAVGYGCAVAHPAGSHNTIAASFEFGGLADGSSPSTKQELMAGMLEFFGLGLPPAQTVAASLDCQPMMGVLPFVSQFTVQLANSTGENRRAAGRLDVTVAGGTSYGNWRAGWTNLSPGEVFSTAWNQSFPALGALVGLNIFTLTAEDVTPAPYNQPPYAPAGDTAMDGCTVAAAAP
jgi:hypothetical protein